MKRATTSERLKDLMWSRRLRQIDILHMCELYSIAYNIPISKANLSSYVTGRVVPSQDKLFLLACALNVSEQWLLGFDVPMDRDEATQKQNDSEVVFAFMQPEDKMILFDALRDPITRKRLVDYAEKLNALRKMDEEAGRSEV